MNKLVIALLMSTAKAQDDVMGIGQAGQSCNTATSGTGCIEGFACHIGGSVSVSGYGSPEQVAAAAAAAAAKAKIAAEEAAKKAKIKSDNISAYNKALKAYNDEQALKPTSAQTDACAKVTLSGTAGAAGQGGKCEFVEQDKLADADFATCAAGKAPQVDAGKAVTDIKAKGDATLSYTGTADVSTCDDGTVMAVWKTVTGAKKDGAALDGTTTPTLADVSAKIPADTKWYLAKGATDYTPKIPQVKSGKESVKNADFKAWSATLTEPVNPYPPPPKTTTTATTTTKTTTSTASLQAARSAASAALKAAAEFDPDDVLPGPGACLNEDQCGEELAGFEIVCGAAKFAATMVAGLYIAADM